MEPQRSVTEDCSKFSQLIIQDLQCGVAMESLRSSFKQHLGYGWLHMTRHIRVKRTASEVLLKRKRAIVSDVVIVDAAYKRGRERMDIM